MYKDRFMTRDHNSFNLNTAQDLRDPFKIEYLQSEEELRTENAGKINNFKTLRIEGSKQGQIVGDPVGYDGLSIGAIKVIAISHEVLSPRDSATGQPSGKRTHRPLFIVKQIDKATPLLYQALITNEKLKNVLVELWKLNNKGALNQYFIIKLINASISSISQVKQNLNSDLIKFLEYEEIGFSYPSIEWTSKVDGKTASTSSDIWSIK